MLLGVQLMIATFMMTLGFVIMVWPLRYQPTVGSGQYEFRMGLILRKTWDVEPIEETKARLGPVVDELHKLH